MPDFSSFKKSVPVAPVELPAALSIAGSDSGGGAGIQADLLTFAARGVFGTTALTALTAQNPAGVSAVSAVPAGFVREQAEQVCRFFPIRAAKTGMLASAEIAASVADFFDAHREIRLVVDPVMIATSGAPLLAPEAVAVLRERLIPRAALVTPNLDEAEAFLGEGKFAWREPGTPVSVAEKEARRAAQRLATVFGVPVLLKGGHGNAGEEIFDVLAFPRKGERVFTSRRVAGTNTHGSGCTLSAAIAAELAKALFSFATEKEKSAPPPAVSAEMLAACVASAGNYVHAAIARPLAVAGTRFLAHFPR